MNLTRRRVCTGVVSAFLLPAAPTGFAGVNRIRVPEDHPTLAEAIAALPESGGEIEIAPGTYREKLTISKPGVKLTGKGKGPAEVSIVWGDSAKIAGGTGKSASLTVTGDGFRATNLTIQNDYHLSQPDTPSQAVALFIRSDRAVLRDVRILGAQDTLYAASKSPSLDSRQYYKDCYIEGHVDFIFGNALAFFHHCDLHILDRSAAFITAHSRTSETRTSAYIFDHCRITSSGAGTYYLGRAWRPYARVIFLNTRIDGHIHPEGWREWTPGKTETFATAYFAEYRSSGSGAVTDQRVSWAKQLTRGEATQWKLKRVFPDLFWKNL